MQILFDSSEEGNKKGLSIFTGKFKNLKNLSKKKTLKVPHIGFNEVKFKLKSNINDDFYFIHSYAIDLKNTAIKQFEDFGITKYEDIDIISYIKKNNFIATQFHPEKSGVTGLNFLKNIC